MTDKTVTGVFVRLPLSEDAAHVFHKESSYAWDEFNGSSNALACEAGLLAIGTPVTGGDLEVFDIADAAYGDANEKYVRQSDAQAAIASLEADVKRMRLEVQHANDTADAAISEVGRLREALATSRDAIMSASEMKRPALEVVRSEIKALKGPEA